MKARCLWSGCLLVLGGCTVGSDYRPPVVPMPPTWRAIPEAPARTGGSWWTSFKDPVLDELIAAALANNPDVETALATIERARAGTRSARAAALPSGTLDGDLVRTRDSMNVGLNRIADQAAGVSINRASTLYDTTATASWELDLFGSLRRQREAAGYEYEAALATGAITRVSIAADVADAYVRFRTAQARLTIAGKLSRARSRLESLVAERYEAGEASLREFQQAQTSSASVDATLPVLRATIKTQRNRIVVLTGRMPQARLGALEHAAPIPLAQLTGLGAPDDLLRRRPDVVAAERRLAAAHTGIGVALAEYYPKVSLSAAAGLVTNSASTLFSGSSTLLQGGLGLRWRLFDFARLDAELAISRAVERGALAAYRASILRAAEDVEAAAILYVSGRERISAHAEESRTADKARNLSNIAWEAGEVGLSEVIEADRRLLEAEDAGTVALGDTAQALIAAYRAIGG